MSLPSHRNDIYYVLFPATGQKFPIRYLQTSDQYEVDLPAGTYGGEYLRDLRKELSADFPEFRITK